MRALLAPRRREGPEILDDPAVDETVVRRSLRDVAVANRLFGGTGTVLAALAPVLEALRPAAGNDGCAISLLDVGTGLGDIPARARAFAARRGVRLRTYGVDGSETLARAADAPALPTVRADALHLPFRDRSVDIAMCSQLLHHFERRQAIAVMRELDRVARRRVIVSDLRRSWLAAAGIWLASWPLRFHPVSRHDGVVSVMRGFTTAELREMARAVTGRVPRVRRHALFRISVSWEPEGGA